MCLNIKMIPFSEVVLFADIMSEVFSSTGKILVKKDYFSFHIKKVMSMTLDKSKTYDMIVDFLDLIVCTYREPKDLSGKTNIFFVEDFQELLKLLNYASIEEMPLYVNSEDPYKKTISIWRLKVGK
jgi:hypothetical protein